MQLAIDILVFALGFCIAVIAGTRPKEIHPILDELSRRLRSLRESLRPDSHLKESKVKAQHEQLPEDEGILLTK